MKLTRKKTQVAIIYLGMQDVYCQDDERMIQAILEQDNLTAFIVPGTYLFPVGREFGVTLTILKVAKFVYKFADFEKQVLLCANRLRKRFKQARLTVQMPEELIDIEDD